MNKFVSVSRNETVEILEPTKRGLHDLYGLYGLHGLHDLYGLYGLYGLHGLHGLRGPHSLQSAVCVLHNISCELAHSINAFS